MKQIFLTLLIISVSAMASFSQNYAKIDTLSQQLIEKYKLPGIAIIAVKDSAVIYSQNFGKANEYFDFTDSTKIYIASNTKAFVGIAMVRLAAEGKINYSEPITQYIDKKYFPKTIEADKITVKNLMTHTHGLSNDPMVFRTAYSGQYPSDLKELLKFTIYQNDSLSYHFKYSNLGYLIAGIIIGEVTNTHWKQYIQQNVLKAAGMSNSSTHINFNSSLEALPYEFFSKMPITSRKSENVLHSACGIYSTMNDMGKWLTLFTDRNQTRIDNAIIDSCLSTKTEVGKSMGPFMMDEYGNGWIHGNLMGDDLLFHFGSFNGYESMMSVNPEQNTGVYVFVNERIGGQRIAAMLSAYFYLIETNDAEADKKIEMFFKFIDPQYSKNHEDKSIFKYPYPELLTGTYSNEKYGHLIVDKTSDGYSFSLGRLKSLAYSNDKNSEDILVEWTPGIIERFNFIRADNMVKLIYGEFGEFIKN